MEVENEKRTGFEVAVIGMAGRFPGAPNVAAFWDNLQNGVESIRFFTVEELTRLGVTNDIARDEQFVRAHGVLDGFDEFDADFFNVTRREAEVMDPQQRIFLEVVWEALEAAGCDPDSYAGHIGVFAGASASDYLNSHVRRNGPGKGVGEFQASVGNQLDFVATRASYKLNLRGPSLTVQTACSTSLVAIHVACQQLLGGNCDIALAGGVSLTLPEHWGYRHEEGMIFSPDGHCRAFDADAQGTLKGDGVGVVVLKRLADALADGDNVDAVVLASAVNNDGSRKVGYTAPSVEGQVEVIRAAQLLADIPPETIGYIEAHGTATPVGDPIEIAALTRAFRETTQRTQFAAIGSVKTNIGHLDAAAGVAGFIKTVLAVKHGVIPPSLHYRRPNPRIDFASSPVYVCARQMAWPRASHSRRASVSSFGIGGTNAHVILEQAPAQASASQSDPDSQRAQLLVLSARSETALERACVDLEKYMEHTPAGAGDVAYTLQTGRRAFSNRIAVVCEPDDTPGSILRSRDANRLSICRAASAAPEVVFLFPGQGAQYVDMARGLYESERAFRESFDTCAELLRQELHADLRDLVFPSAASRSDAEQALVQTRIAQPAVFCVEYALASWWSALGIKPVAVIGHSVGEFAAACVTGVLSVADAIALVALRAQLMQAQPPGRMSAVPLSPEKVRGTLCGNVSIAAINAPELCVVSGPDEAVARCEARIRDTFGVDCRPLHTSHAFHSAMMQPAVAPFVAAVRERTLHDSRAEFVSTVTGGPPSPYEMKTPEYWGRNLRDPVQYAAALDHVLKKPGRVFLEVGPGNTLTSLAGRHPAWSKALLGVASLRHPYDTALSDRGFALRAVGKLWCAGVKVRWDALHAGPGRRVALPAYPFERTRFWLEPGPVRQERNMPSGVRGHRNSPQNWYYVPGWRSIPITGEVDAEHVSPLRWLIFADRSGIGDEVAKRLTMLGHQVTIVARGSGYRRNSPVSFELAPGQAADFMSLVENLRESDALPHRVLYAWSLDVQEHLGGGDASDVAASALGSDCLGLVHLVQALGACTPQENLKILVATTHSVEVGPSDPLDPLRAAFAPLCVVSGQEYGWPCRIVDIGNAASVGAAADTLIKESGSARSALVTAHRGRHRWERTYEQVVLPRTANPRLRQGGVYLITGGLGNLGLALAEHLARHHRARIMLVGRRGVPERERWPELLATHSVEDAQVKLIQRLQAIEALGGEILVARADVSDFEAMHAETTRLRVRFGALHGIIHAAGEINENTLSSIADCSAEMIERQLRPKLGGARVIERLCEREEPDFVLLVSSLASVVGGHGYGAYAAANAVMDFYAEAARRRGGPWVSVGLDRLNFGTPSAAEITGRSLSEFSISAEQIGRVFERILSFAEHPHVLVSTTDPLARVRLDPMRDARDTRAGSPDAASAVHSETVRRDFVPLSSETERIIATIWEDLLGVHPIGAEHNFFELGGDSVVGIQTVSRLKQRGLVLAPRDVFQHQTVAALAAMVSRAPAPRPSGDSPAKNVSPGDLEQLAKLITESDSR